MLCDSKGMDKDGSLTRTPDKNLLLDQSIPIHQPFPFWNTLGDFTGPLESGMKLLVVESRYQIYSALSKGVEVHCRLL